MPPVTPVVKYFLIINIAVFIPSFLFPKLRFFLDTWFSVYPASLGVSLQLWRFVTYQFMHGGIMHILLNMLVLYFFGPLFEKHWGSKKFTIFYLACGAIGGIAYSLLGGFDILNVLHLVGASGSIYGLLAAGAVLFPKMRVYFFGIIPLSLLTLVIIAAVISTLLLLTGENAGGEAAHLAGMAAGAGYVLWGPLLEKRRTNAKRGVWESKIVRKQLFQAEVDRILDKVHNQGITSLTRKEKKILQEASRQQQDQR
jgi:membrane associated rhomboid family serine protease